MKINVEELRKKPKINWLVPFEWMSKLTNAEIEEWERSITEEHRELIRAENRPINTDEEWNQKKIEDEIKARVIDNARLVEIDYKKVTLK